MKPKTSGHINTNAPTFAEEKALKEQGYALVAGIDEVGRGCLAGPVAAAAVILPIALKGQWLKQVRDSKLLSPEKRDYLAPIIEREAVAVGFAMVSAEEIDARGILHASKKAMRLAVESLSPQPDFLLIDAIRIPQLNIPQKGIIKGDRLCFSISCASIVAKVKRDSFMVEMDGLYPGYGLAENKGYATANHLAALERLGASPIHRRNFSPVRAQLL